MHHEAVHSWSGVSALLPKRSPSISPAPTPPATFNHQQRFRTHQCRECTPELSLPTKEISLGLASRIDTKTIYGKAPLLPLSAPEMKFLDYDKLSAITEALALREAGDKVLNGRLEAYSCECPRWRTAYTQRHVRARMPCTLGSLQKGEGQCRELTHAS
eukprot:55915-Eustigmatos_ZCMA.PRE.1